MRRVWGCFWGFAIEGIDLYMCLVDVEQRAYSLGRSLVDSSLESPGWRCTMESSVRVFVVFSGTS